MRRTLFPGTLTLIVSLVLAVSGGCKKRETRVEEGNRTQTFHRAIMDEPSDLDPHTIGSHDDHEVVMALMEGLTDYKLEDSTPVPGAAERWEHNEDHTRYTFFLRKEGKWSNGDPVTAHDFVYACQRILSPALGSEYASLLHYLRNGEDFNTGKLKDFNQVGVRALDDYTLQFDLRSPVPYFPGLLAHSAYYPVHKATIEKFGRMDQRGSAWTREGNYVGNGAFVLQDWKQNQFLRVVKSKTYWNRDAVRLNQINFYPYNSEMAQEAAFRSGLVHVIPRLPADKIAVYREKQPEVLMTHPSLITYFYRLNLTKPPLDNPKVRRALALAVDRQQLVEKVTKGGERPAYHLTPPDVGFVSRPVFKHDPAEARRLLAEAGFPEGRGFPKIDVLFNTSEAHRQIAETLQQMWKKELGIDIGLFNQEARVWNDTMRQMNYHIARYGWVGDYLDASTFLELFESTNGNNQTGFKNQEYDDLIRKARITGNQQERLAAFQRCEEILAEEAPLIPIYFYSRNYLKHPAVKNWPGNPLDLYPWTKVFLQP